MIILRNKFFADSKEDDVNKLAEEAYKKAELRRKANNVNIKVKAGINRVSLPKEVIEKYKQMYLQLDPIDKEKFVQDFIENYDPEQKNNTNTAGNITKKAIDKVADAVKIVSRPLQGVGKSLKNMSENGKILENTVNGALDVVDTITPSSTTIRVVTGKPITGLAKDIVKGYIPGGRAILRHGNKILRATDKNVILPVEDAVNKVPGVGYAVKNTTKAVGHVVEGLGNGLDKGIDYVSGGLKNGVDYVSQQGDKNKKK